MCAFETSPTFKSCECIMHGVGHTSQGTIWYVYSVLNRRGGERQMKPMREEVRRSWGYEALVLHYFVFIPSFLFPPSCLRDTLWQGEYVFLLWHSSKVPVISDGKIDGRYRQAVNGRRKASALVSGVRVLTICASIERLKLPLGRELFPRLCGVDIDLNAACLARRMRAAWPKDA